MYSNDIDQYLNRTRFVELPGLGIPVELPRNTHLYVKGEVKDPLEFDAEFKLILEGLITESRTLTDRILNPILDRFMKSIAVGKMREAFPNDDKSIAHCFEHTLRSPNTGRLFAISKRSGLEHSMSVFADGHESGEFLQKTELQDELQKALNDEGIAIDVKQFHGEDFADIAGFLALHKAKKAGDQSIRIPVFKDNRENREKMGRLFGLEPLEDESEKL